MADSQPTTVAAEAEPRRRTRLDPERRREEVLTAATALFERQPYDRLTTAHLAAGCGVSEGLIFHYFGSKRGLYMASLEHSLDEFLGSIRDPGPELPLPERLGGAIDSYLDFVETYPRSYAAVLRGGVGADPEVHELTQRARERFCELIATGLGLEQGTPAAELRVWGWMGLVEATCTRWLETRELERAELRELLVEGALATLVPA